MKMLSCPRGHLECQYGPFESHLVGQLRGKSFITAMAFAETDARAVSRERLTNML